MELLEEGKLNLQGESESESSKQDEELSVPPESEASEVQVDEGDVGGGDRDQLLQNATGQGILRPHH